MKKLTTAWVFLLTTCLVYGQVEEERMPFLKAVDKLEQDFNVIFAFDHHLLADLNVDTWDANLELKEVLSGFSDSFEIRFEMVGSTVLVIPEDSNPSSLIEVSGQIIDHDSQFPLPNAIVKVVGADYLTMTDQHGKFQLTKVPSDGSIEISYLGYNSRIIPINQIVEDDGFSYKLKNNAEVLNEVTITEMNHSFATHNQALGSKIDQGAVRSLSNLGEADVVRAMQMLPGVRGTNESSSEIVVRGTGSNQVLTQFDGMTLYRTDHFFGNMSAFNPEIIQSAHLHKSAYRAPWGTRASSVLDIASKRANFDKVSGNVGLNLLNFSAMLETPLTSNLSLMVSGRRAFSDIIQSGLYKNLFDNSYNSYDGLNSNEGLLEDSEGVESSFYFYDVNAKLSWRIDPNSILDISFYQGNDNLTQEDQSANTTIDGATYVRANWKIHEKNVWGNAGIAAKWSRNWNKRFFTDVQIAHSKFEAKQDFNSSLFLVIDSASYRYAYNSHGLAQLDNIVKETSVKLNSEYRIGVDHKLGFGMYSIDYHSGRDYTTLNDGEASYNSSYNSTGQVNGIYGEWQASITDRLSFTPGIRLSKYSEDGRIYREPRIALNYQINRHLNLKASAGKHYQFMIQVETVNMLLNNNNLWILADGIDVPVVESDHYVAGATWSKRGFSFDVEGYYKSMNGLLEFVEVPVFDEGNYPSQVTYSSFYNVGEGRSYGLDFLVKKQSNVYTGWISYSLGRSEIRLPDTNQQKFFPSEFDQLHELKVVNMLSLGDWDISMSWLYGSGTPFTYSQPYDTVYTDNANVDGSIAYDIELNNARLPAYHRLDFSIARNFNLENSRLTTGLNIQNVYDRTNIRKIINIDESGSFAPKSVTHLGFTPSIYLKYYF